MKKILLLTAIFLAASVVTSQARIRIPVGEHQKIAPVLELPDSAYYRTDAGYQLNVGHMYTVYEVAYIPLWTTEKGQLVGFTAQEPNTYYELDDEMLEWIAEDTGVEEFDTLKTLPFWDAWGGKLTAVAIVIVLIYYFRNNKDEEEQPSPEEPAKEA